MNAFKENLIKMLNKALEFEQAARIQYLSHAELIKGVEGVRVIERFKEIASDEQKHQDQFRGLISGYLGGKPSMGMAKTYKAQDSEEILTVNLKNEENAVDFYEEIYQKVIDNKEYLKHVYQTLEHEIRHIIMDEQAHIVELFLLLGS